jgi:hypothetical protein
MTTLPDPVAPAYAQAIGYIAITWSAVEYNVNTAIWGLAGVPSGIGACLTAQLYSFDSRMKALVSLMHLKRLKESLVKEANRLHEDSRGPLELRNRAVHDYWVWNEVGEIYRLEATAAKKLSLKPIPVSLADLESQRQALMKLAERSGTLSQRIYAALPSLPEIPQTELAPIIRRPLDQ